MLKNRTTEALTAAVLVAPFVVIYCWMFVYPTVRMAQLSLTDAPLIGAGHWTGLDNYRRLVSDKVFWTAVWNTSYFVLLTVVPGTAAALGIALMVSRLNGWLQSLILTMFFLPYVLPVTVVYLIWMWLGNVQFGVLQVLIVPFAGHPINVWRAIPWFMPWVGMITIWWTNGSSILLFLAGLRNIPREIYEAAVLDERHATAYFRARDLAADLAGDCAVPDHWIDPAARYFRSGLSVRAPRPHDGDDGLVGIYLRAGLPA